MSDGDVFWWCLDHARVEPATTTCRADRRLGPYASAEAARDWRERHESREDAWAAEDERWSDDDEDDEDGWGDADEGGGS